MRTALYGLALLVALPAFWIAGMVATNPLTAPRFEPVDLSDAPLDLAVLVAWETPEGETACRAVYHRDLGSAQQQVPSPRFAVTDEEWPTCLAQFSGYARTRRWAHELERDLRGYTAHVLRSPDDPRQLEVTYASDVDRVAVTRYRIDERGQPADFEFKGSFGPARGIGVLLFGIPTGTAAWLALVGLLGIRWHRRRSGRGES